MPIEPSLPLSEMLGSKKRCLPWFSFHQVNIGDGSFLGLFFLSGVIIQRPNQKLHVTLPYAILELSLRVSTKRASFLQPRANPLFTRPSKPWHVSANALSMTFHCNRIWMNKKDYCRVMLLYA